MANNSISDTEQQSDVAKTATRATAPKKSTSGAKATVKPTSKPAVKPAAKHTAKAPTKAAEKPASKPAADQEAMEKGDAEKSDKKAKPKKAKQVRDSFTMPKSEYDLIAAVKKRCVVNGLAVKKSEVLRAAIIGFAAQSDATVLAALQALEVIKTGRPPKGKGQK